MDLLSIQKWLEENLSERRYKHSLGVADEAKRLAERYNYDQDRAYLAGLIHDCAKEIPAEQMQDILQNEYSIQVDSVSAMTPKILHGPLGACYAQSKLGVTDPEILDAIRYHTTGKADMPLLTKIVYIADYIEPNRDFDNVNILRNLAYQDIDKAIIKGIDYTVEDLIERGLIFHPDTVYARNSLIIGLDK